MDGRPWLLPGAVRAAAPLLVAHGALVVVGLGWKPALLFVLAAPSDVAHFAVMDETLAWVASFALLGLPTAVLRLAPEHPAERGSIASTAIAMAGLAVALVLGVFAASPALRRWLLGDVVAAEMFVWYGLRLPSLAAVAVLLAMVHAAGRLRRKGALQVGERLAFVVPALGGAWLAGIPGLVAGAVIGSAAAAGTVLLGALPAVGDRAAWPSRRWVRPLLAVGGVQAGVMLFETARTVGVLRVMTASGQPLAEVAGLGAALALILPAIAGPELIAQALYPRMIGPGGVATDLDGVHGRMLGELVAVFLPLLIVYGLAAAWLLAVARGGALASGAIPALLLVPGVAAHGIVAQTGYVLLVRDRLPRALGVSVVALCVTLGLSVWLVPLLGAIGAAAALSSGLVVRALLLVFSARGDA